MGAGNGETVNESLVMAVPLIAGSARQDAGGRAGTPDTGELAWSRRCWTWTERVLLPASHHRQWKCQANWPVSPSQMTSNKISRIEAIKPEIAAIVLSGLFEGNTCWQVVTKRVAGSGPSSLLV